MNPKIFNDDQQSETRAEIHAETRDWFPTAESLVQQLSSDAQRLAQRYPAPNANALLVQMLREQAAAAGSHLNEALQPMPAETDRVTLADSVAPRKAQRAAAWPYPQFAAAALVLIAGWSLLRWSAEKPLAPANKAANHSLANAGEQSNETMIPVALPNSPLEPQEFQTLSAPEREAVLDLLEEQALGTVSLSI
jgi:hypothetical protein